MRPWCELAACLALALVPCACGEEPRSPWVLSGSPRALALRMDVVEDGELAGDLAALPATRRRAEVLPGDVVELRALVATADGEVDLDAAQAAWFMCDIGCPFNWESEVPDCADVEPNEVTVCLAGRGAAPQVVVPGDLSGFGTSTVRLWATLVLISGLQSRQDTDACVSSFQSRTASMQGCAIGVRLIAYGPDWRILEERLAGSELVPEAWPGVPLDIARLLQPNAAPELRHVWTRVEEEPLPKLHALSEPLRVPAGSTLYMWPEPEVIDRQLTIQPVPGVAHGYQGYPESIDIELFASEEIGQAQPGPAPQVLLVAPDEPTSMTLWLVVGDGRGARSWSRANLEVVAP